MAYFTLLAVDHHPSYHLARLGIVLVHTLEARHCRSRRGEHELLHGVTLLGCVGGKLLSSVVGAEEFLELAALSIASLCAGSQYIFSQIIFHHRHCGVLLGELSDQHALACTLTDGDILAACIAEAIECLLGKCVGFTISRVEGNPLLELSSHAVGAKLAHERVSHHLAAVQVSQDALAETFGSHRHEIDLDRINC